MNYNSLIERRLKAISLVVVLITIVLIGRFFTVSVIKHDHYLAMAKEQQQFEKVELAQRGKIYVHDSYFDPGKYYPMAFDIKRFAVWAVPQNIRKKNEAAAELSGLIGMPQQEIFDKINNDKLYIPPLKHGLTLEAANKLKEADISGVLVVPEYSRYYPETNLASHVLGFVNADGVGNYGFEGHYNEELKGLAGDISGEKDTLGNIINLTGEKAPQDGTSYVLTLDRSVQYYIEKKLAEAITTYQADSGSVVVMDVKTGGIVAMASAPNYDPNNFRDYAKDNSGVYVNPVIGHLYEPGSIFKPIVMAAAIDQGAVAPDTRNVFGSTVVVDGFTIHTANGDAFGDESMADILKNSDNVGMVWVSEKLGKENMYNYIKNFGFFNKTGIDLDTEAIGYTKQMKQWANIDRSTIAFGQGINVSPIQLVAAYAALANRGVYEYPHIVDKIILPDGTEKDFPKQEGKTVIKESTAQSIREMLTRVTDEGHGWRAGVPGYEVASKTGTAQIVVNGAYDQNETGLGIYNHSMAGFAPANDPRFAMIVKLERPKSARYADSTAAPLFGDISSFLLNYYYRVPPTREVKPLR